MDRFLASYDPRVQTAADRFIQERMVDDVATVVIEVRKDTFAYNSDLHDFHPNQVTPFDDLADVDI
jgi:hypothetical protein